MPFISSSNLAYLILSSSSEHDDFDDRIFSGAALRKALEETLSMLGATWKEKILEDLEHSDMRFDRKSKYTVGQIREKLQSLLGKDGAELLMERLKKALTTK